ncbi:MAG: hypothetical protein SGILL_010569, partial [Bacillariaceae sp.]
DKIVNAFDKSKQTDVDDEEDFAAILTNETETGKIYTRGYDDAGRACMYMRPANENTVGELNNLRHLVFQLEKAVACSNKNGHGKICLIIDYDGFQVSQAPPMSTTRKVLEILQRHYAERMFRAYGMQQIVEDMGGKVKAMKHLEPCAGGVEKLRAFDNVDYLSKPFNHGFDEVNYSK